MNVYTWRFTWRYALRHPIRIIRWFFRCRKMASQRARRGWCDNDATDWYNWVGYVLSGLLNQIGENAVVPDSRKAWLKKLSYDLHYAIADSSEEDACSDKLNAICSREGCTPEERQEAYAAYRKHISEIVSAKKQLVQKSFQNLGKDFFSFWSPADE